MAGNHFGIDYSSNHYGELYCYTPRSIKRCGTRKHGVLTFSSVVAARSLIKTSASHVRFCSPSTSKDTTFCFCGAAVGPFFGAGVVPFAGAGGAVLGEVGAGVFMPGAGVVGAAVVGARLGGGTQQI